MGGPRGGGGAVLFALHMAATDKQEFILYHEESTKTLFLFREEGRYSVRAWMVVEERAGWRYLHEGCRCEPLCTESWLEHLSENLCLEHKPITWGIFFYPTVSHWIQA